MNELQPIVLPTREILWDDGAATDRSGVVVLVQCKGFGSVVDSPRDWSPHAVTVPRPALRSRHIPRLDKDLHPARSPC